MNRATPFLLVVALLFAFASSPSLAQIKIALAGDSTVTDDAGWGLGFAKALGDQFEVFNNARSGRSSKSYYDEGWWKQILDWKPDYVLIQFGHNDQPGKGPERETDPATTYRANLIRYIDEARAIGATPILVTSIARRRWSEDNLAVPSSLVPWVEVAIAVGKEKDVPVIDLHERSIEFYLSLGRAGCELISLRGDNGRIDNTHFNVVGGEMFGPLVAWELRMRVPALSKIRGYIPPENRKAGEMPMIVPTPPELAAALAIPAEPPTPRGAKTITVSLDGTGDFKRIQDAVVAVEPNNADRTTIVIKPGVHYGPIVVPPSRQNVSFVGEGADKSIISYALNVTDPIGVGVPRNMAGTGVIILGDGFHASDLTFRNVSGDHGQAMALRLQADRCVLERVRMLGWQDTLRVNAKRQYIRDTYIEGRVDFIYGGSTVVFENCEIKSKLGGYITAASTPQENEFGYVFLNCRLTSDDGTPTFLGRPWRPFGAVAFIHCEMGSHIRPEGWDNWRNPENEKTARFAEFGSTGPGGDTSHRVKWATILTADEAAKYTAQNVLAGEDGWDPTR